MPDPRIDSNIPWAVRMLLKAGLRNKKQAETALLIFTGLCVVLSVWIILPRKTVPPQNDVQQNPNYEPR